MRDMRDTMFESMVGMNSTPLLLILGESLSSRIFLAEVALIEVGFGG